MERSSMWITHYWWMHELGTMHEVKGRIRQTQWLDPREGSQWIFLKFFYIIITLTHYLIIRKINFTYKNKCSSSLISKLPFHFLNETLKAEQTANQSTTEGKVVGHRAGQRHSTMRRLIGSRRAHKLQNFHILKFRFTVRLNSFFTAYRQKAKMLTYI